MNHTTPSLSLYWKCQLTGWSIAALYWTYGAYFSGRFSIPIALLHFILDVGMGITITHAYRILANKKHWTLLPLPKLAGRMMVSVLVLSIIYTSGILIKNYLLQIAFNPGYQLPLMNYITNNGSTLLITGIRLLSIWILAYHLYHYAQREILMAKENARLLLLNKETQLANLTAQLNPHFLFNSLNNIKALVADQPTSARRAVDLLAELLRNSLYRTNDQLITLADELNLVQDYLELEKLRFEERLEVKLSIGQDTVMALIPPLSIQTLVENAIKHGIDQRKEGGLLEIEVSRQDGLIQINVFNPGKLIWRRSQGHLGIQNLSERLQLQFNSLHSRPHTAAAIKLQQWDEQTVLASLYIPFDEPT